VPQNIPVRIEHIGGDAFLSGIPSRLEIQKVGGDLLVEKCAQVDLAIAGGDLTARMISGPFNIQKVSGDLRGEELAGGLSVESVGGDARFQAAGGGLRLRVGGDLILALPVAGSEEVVLKAGGDITLFVAAQVGAQLDLSSGGRDICIEVGGNRIQSDDPVFVTKLGDGSRPLRARAGGDIQVRDEAWNEDDLSEEFDQQLEEWEKWKSNQGTRQMDWNNLESRIRNRAEAGARRAEGRVREAMERVERKTRREGMFGNFNWGNFNPQPPARPPAPAAPVPPMAPQPFGDTTSQYAQGVSTPDYPEQSGVSNDERMLVLKMLQEHKITLEEAEELLKSLEGDFE